MSQQIASGDRAALVARLADLIEVPTGPDVVELTSLAEALARAHGLAWGRKAPQ